MLSNEKKQQIVARLNQKIEKYECPLCHQGKFTLVDGYIPNNLQNRLDGITIGGSMIPTVAIVCNHCGFVSQHSLGALGLLDDVKKNRDN